MKLPDVNVLIYAFRAGTPHHQICKMWLDQRVRGDEAFAISNQVLSAVVRIATNRRLFEAPSPLDEAFAFCRDIISQDHCRIVEPGPRHWAIFE
ncbi:MAG: TA system VapC family ribonuclease toxin, partial [Pseudomonadota bacterium]